MVGDGRAVDLSAQHRELVPQHDDLQVLGAARANSEPGEPDQKAVQRAMDRPLVGWCLPRSTGTAESPAPTRYVYRAVDQNGQVIDVYVSSKRDTTAATRFSSSAITAHGEPVEVTTDKSPVLAKAIRELVSGAHHGTTQYANNRVDADHGRLKARLRPMRGLQPGGTASVIIRGHALMQNLRRGHYDLGVDALPGLTTASAFDELAGAV